MIGKGFFISFMLLMTRQFHSKATAAANKQASSKWNRKAAAAK